jgi:UDP-glucuronate 4-epimerase
MPLNIAAGTPSPTLDLIELFASLTGKQPKIELVARPEIDVEKTWADTTLLESQIGRIQTTPLATGLENFYRWFLSEVHH